MAAFAVSPAGAGDQSVNLNKTTSGICATTNREVSELEKDNLSRVAASAAQIRAVLVKDPGLLVELKRWIAKEATDNGQIVSDEDLTDNAVFDRLTTDVVFRSVATRLVQRYGYLLPTVDPESEMGKQQELLIKERVSAWFRSNPRKMRNLSSLTSRRLAKQDPFAAIPMRIANAFSASSTRPGRSNANPDEIVRSGDVLLPIPTKYNPSLAVSPKSSRRRTIPTISNVGRSTDDGGPSFQKTSNPLKQPGDL